MSSSALRTLALVLFVVAILLGVVAYLASSGASDDMPATHGVTDVTQSQFNAVVAAHPLMPYQKIKPKDVSLVSVQVAPSHYFTNVQQVIGREPVREVDRGSPLSSKTFNQPSALAKAVPPGTEAMSIAVSNVVAAGGFIRPGDFVDVLVYIRASGGQVDDTQARILLRDVRVLGYRQQLINGSAGKQDEHGGRDSRTAVIAVPEPLITRAMLGASVGTLRLALRRAAVKPRSASGQSAQRPDDVSPAASDHNTQPKSAPDRKGNGVIAPVITLKELTRLAERQSHASKPTKHHARRRRPTVEVYKGASSQRVSRPN